jgi:hypothetical protein
MLSGRDFWELRKKLDGSRKKHTNSLIPQYYRAISYFPRGQIEGISGEEPFILI